MQDRLVQVYWHLTICPVHKVCLYQYSVLVSACSSVIICEHEEAYVRCSPGTKIHITGAAYGRMNGFLCKKGNTHNTSCRAHSSTHVVRGWCEGRQICEVFADNHHFSDPCYGTFKYLQVDFECV